MKVLIHYLVKAVSVSLLLFCFFNQASANEGNPAQTKHQTTDTMSGSSQKVKKILASGKNPIVILETTAGNLELELYPKVAPKAVENFLELVNRGYYDGITFHRIIKGFMIQGGDPTGTGRGGESIFGGAFEDEIALGYAFDHGGILAMANAGPNTNRSQFFITTGRASWLNGLHTIFGELKNGFDVLTKLESVRTDENNRPLQTERIIKAKILE